MIVAVYDEYDRLAASVDMPEHFNAYAVPGILMELTNWHHYQIVEPEDEHCKGSWIDADDVDRMARELDVAWNGVAGAAPQAALCDIVGQIVGDIRSGRVTVRP